LERSPDPVNENARCETYSLDDMAFIHEGSCECAKSELDLFSVPAMQTSIESGTYVEYHPISSLTGAAPIEFDVSASGDDYLDLANSFLCVRTKITRVNNDDLDAADTVGPVNNFLQLIFPSERVAERHSNYKFDEYQAYNTYIKTLLSYGLEAKLSQLTSALFYKEEAGKMDISNPLAANAIDRNSGLAKRQTFGAESREIDMIGRIHTDIIFQERYMLNEVNAKKIKLIRSNDAFCLMATGGQQFKIVVTAASLLIRKIKSSPSVFLAHVKTLDNGTAKYPIRHVICKSFAVRAGYLDAFF
jgi:hypothetical protein